MKTYDFAYGRGRKEFSIDESLVIKEVRTEEFTPMSDIKQGVLDAIYNPIGCESIDKIIKPGDTVAFICNDPTRVANSYDFMPVLVNEFNKLGVKDEDMHIVFSLGTHRDMTHEEMVEAVGEEVSSRLKMYNSTATKDEDFEYFGTTSRGTPVWINKHLCHVDHVILTGTIVHHYFSGYGGGRKAILPGCAAMETVRVASCSIKMQVWAARSAIPATKTKWKASRSLLRAVRCFSSTLFSMPSTNFCACSRAIILPHIRKPANSSMRYTAA